jgi:hypothetical protein
MGTLRISRALRALVTVVPFTVSLHTQLARAETHVDIAKELMITDLQVIEDPVRTDPNAGVNAVWTFKYLIEQMAGDSDPADFVMNWLMQWTVDQELNGSLSPARPQILEKVLDPWLAASGGRKLDLTLAPFKLLAIVNRMDLRDQKEETVHSAGEGRFVFGVLDKEGKPLPPVGGPVVGGFTVIFEYKLLAQNPKHLKQWAHLWHALSRFELGTQAYNERLERLTKRFSDQRRGSRLGLVNHSPLNQIRTNEVSLASPWEMREFVLDPQSGQLVQHPVARTPDFLAFNGTPEFADFINDNETALLKESFTLSSSFSAAVTPTGPFVKEDIPGFDFRTFSAHEPAPGVFLIPWSAAGIRNNDARHAFALTTCGGCHVDETGTGFLHVGFPQNHQLPASLGTPAKLSGYLTGISLPDPVDGKTMRRFDELERRQEDFMQLLKQFTEHRRSATG